jgi:hypothetical protein
MALVVKHDQPAATHSSSFLTEVKVPETAERNAGDLPWSLPAVC